MASGCFVDPRGTRVWFFDLNFPKLIKLQRPDPSTGKLVKATASRVLPFLRNGSFREADYTWDAGRASTLLWLPDVIIHPDSIHPNSHRVIVGDQVYVKRYAKAGSPFKVLYTLVAPDSGHRVPATSFWVPKDELKQYVAFPALWEKQKAAVASGLLSPKSPGPG